MGLAVKNADTFVVDEEFGRASPLLCRQWALPPSH